jgi:signal transduction histidine kinase
MVKGINTDSLDHMVTSPADTVLIGNVLQKGYDLLNENKEESMHIADWAIAACERIGHKRLLAFAHLLRGRVERRNSHYDKAIYHFLLALNIYEELRDYHKISSVCNSIGIIYMNLGNFPKALKYEQYALEQNDKVSPPNYKAYTDVNNQMGAAYFELNQFDNAYRHFMDAYNAAVFGKDTQGMAISMDNLTRIYIQRKQFDKAVESATRSYQFAQNSGDSGTMAFNLSVIATTYLQKGDYPKALKALKESEKISKLRDDRELWRGLYRIYSDYYKFTGNYKKALEYYELLKVETDSSRLEEANNRIVELESRYEVEKKNAAYALLKKENALQEASLETATTQKWALLMISLVTLTGAGVVVYYLLQKNKINKRLAALNEEKTNVMSILSHDLRAPFTKVNTLVQLITQKEQDDKQLEYLDKINRVVKDGTELIQNLLDTTYMEEHKPAFRVEEIDMLELMQLIVEQYTPQAARKHITLHLDVDMDELLMNSDRNKLMRIIDNLVSNAIKYSSPNKQIWITVTEVGDEILIKVRDEGQGMDADDQQKLFAKFGITKASPTGGESSTGMGLYITKQLCEWLGGSIRAESEPGVGTTFYVELPRTMGVSG